MVWGRRQAGKSIAWESLSRTDKIFVFSFLCEGDISVTRWKEIYPSEFSRQLKVLVCKLTVTPWERTQALRSCLSEWSTNVDSTDTISFGYTKPLLWWSRALKWRLYRACTYQSCLFTAVIKVASLVFHRKYPGRVFCLHIKAGEASRAKAAKVRSNTSSKGDKAGATMWLHIVCVGQCVYRFIPCAWIIIILVEQGSEKNRIDSFALTTCLGVTEGPTNI